VLRSTLCAAFAASVLTLLIGPGRADATPAPSSTTPRPDARAGLTVHPEWGTVTGVGGVLRRGCHTYTYGYALQPPEGIWALEIFISGPGLEPLGGGGFLDGYDPESGSSRYTLCRATTRHGKFTIEAKLSVDDGAGHITDGLLPADTFRLRRPHR